MKIRIVMSICCCFLLMLGESTAFADGYKVAIFDYDLRLDEQKTVAQHIETQLRASGLMFSDIEQFTGYEDEDKTLEILGEIELKRFDLVITVTSDAMIPAYHKLKKTPVLFTNVNNPKFYGIKDLKTPGRNRSGVTYYVPVEQQIDYFQKITGSQIKKLGFIFDATAKSRVAELKDFRDVTEQVGIEALFALVHTADEMPQKTEALIKQGVDAIVLTSSGKVYKNVDKILDLTTSKRIPIFSVNKAGVAQGAVLALASDYYLMVDRFLVPMAIDVLKNERNPGEMPVQYLEEPFVYLNFTQAEKLGLKIPEAIRYKAVKTY